MTICSPVRRVESHVARDLTFPAVAVGEQALLVVVELLARLGGELEVRAFHDGVHGTGLLAQAAIDAFHHVGVVAGGPPRAVVAARSRLDGDGLGRADRLAQLARYTALLAVGIAAQRVLAAEARRERAFFEGIVKGRLRLEEITHRQRDGADEFPQKQRSGRLAHFHDSHPKVTAPALIRSVAGRRPRSPPRRAIAAGTPSSPAASAGRSDSGARTPSPRRT